MSALVSKYARTNDRNLTPHELLGKPAGSLMGMDGDAVKMLEKLGIRRVYDLAASTFFQKAALVLSASEGAKQPLGRHGMVPGDLISDDFKNTPVAELALKPVKALRGITAEVQNDINLAFDIGSIRELALWPPYRMALAILAEASGEAEGGRPDPEAPPDLVPASGRYPTERVQYDVIVLDDPGARDPKPLEAAGPLDLAAAAKADTGFTKPAAGALLTYTQSWYTEGLSLGQLLHSVALAPGESTKIAMIDWSRRQSARLQESVGQTESLFSDVERTRSISEIVHSVAREAQQGFSRTSSMSLGGQLGAGAGAAGAVDLGSLIGLPLKLGGGGGLSMGFGGGVSEATTTAWTTGQRELSATMAQNVMDRTHQASNSARNRWATVVREVSEEESEKISTRTLTNYNHMHALSVEYFEVVQLYRVVVELARATPCLFVPMKILEFSDAVVSRYKQLIAAAGLTPRVRVLARAEPDMVALSASRRSQPWNTQTLAFLSYPPPALAGKPDSAELIFDPRYLTADGFGMRSDSPIEAIVLEHPTLGVITLPVGPLPEGPRLTGHGAAFPSTFAMRPDGTHPFWEVLRVTARKKPDALTFEGEVAFYVPLSRIARPGFPNFGEEFVFGGLTLTVKMTAGEQDTVILEMTRSLAKPELVKHLTDNALYYSQVIWRGLDSATIGQLLSGYSHLRRPVLSMIDPVPLAVAGNYLIFRRHIPANDEASHKDWGEWQKAHDIEVGERKEDLVPLPSGGVFAEAVLGRFNAAEKLDMTRFWNWQDSPIPFSAPEIAAIRSGSRAQPADVKPGELGQPILNIVNAPDLPAPLGLGAVLSAVGNGNLFRDMSGAAATAALAQAALNGAFGAANNAVAQAAANFATAAGLVGSSDARPKTPDTPSTEGARINYGAEMDRRGVGGPSGVAGAGQVLGPNEKAAFDNTLGGGGAPRPGGTAQLPPPTPGPSPVPAPIPRARERVVRIFSRYPGGDMIVHGLYDVAVQLAGSATWESHSFDIVPNAPFGQFRTRLQAGDWTVVMRIAATFPAELWRIPVEAITGMDPFTLTVSQTSAPDPVPIDVVKPIGVKEGAKVVDMVLQPLLQEAVTERQIKLSAGAGIAATATAEIKAGMEAEVNALIEKASFKGEIALGGSVEMTGTVGAEQSISVKITYKKLTGFKVVEKE